MTMPELSAEADQAAQWVWLARIRHPQGRKGEVFADILTDFPEKFAQRRRLWLLAESVKCTGFSLHNQEPEKGMGFKVKGTGFSPYIDSPKTGGALAPAGQPSAGSYAKAPPREVELTAHWPHKGGIVLHFAGIDSISAAETLKGLIVAIPVEQRASLAEDEVYIADLIGCQLIDVAGPAPVVVGQIEDVDRTAGPVALLVVQGASGEVLVPFAKSFLRKIDLDGKRVEMALPEGLADLNA